MGEQIRISTCRQAKAEDPVFYCQVALLSISTAPCTQVDWRIKDYGIILAINDAIVIKYKTNVLIMFCMVHISGLCHHVIRL